MNSKYYLIETMCGHVGNNKYIPIVFPVTALNKETAIEKARNIPRVKHTYKRAIISVKEVSYDEYLNQLEVNSKDQYLNWKECRFDDDYDEEGILKRVLKMNCSKIKDKEYLERRQYRREKMYFNNHISELLYSLDECDMFFEEEFMLEESERNYVY